MDLQTYRRLLDAGKPVPKGTVKKLVGRILRGKDAYDFQTTTNDLARDAAGEPILDAQGNVQPNRPLVLLVDGDALGDLIGIANNTYAMLHAVGYDPKDIEAHYRNGLSFKLVVFEDNGSSLATLGTWDNVITMAGKMFEDDYPGISDILNAYRDALKSHSFADILAMAGDIEWSQVQHGDPRYTGPQELLRFCRDGLRVSRGSVSDRAKLVAVRRFFFDALHLRKLYAGDGWTYDSTGKRGVPEYLVPTCPLAKLGKHLVIDLPELKLPRTTTTGRASTASELPIPDFFNPKNAESWAYGPNHDKLLDAAPAFRAKHGIKSAMTDAKKVYVLDIDNQKDFSIPGGALYVGGRSQTGAVDDNVRFTEWKYRNLHRITRIVNTMDTHPLFAIHSRSAWLGIDDRHLAPFTDVPLADIEAGRARVNPMFASMLGVTPAWMDRQVRHYANELMKGGQYTLTVWPTHCVIGSDGYALAGITQEVRAFHAYVRGIMNDPEIKGGNPLTENYGVMSPEVLTRWDGGTMAQKNTRFLELLLSADVVVIGGQAASHCVRSSIDQILTHVLATDPQLAKKIYLLRDCMSSVVTPVYDYTPEAEAALARFAAAGMHVVDSITPMEDWPDIDLA